MTRLIADFDVYRLGFPLIHTEKVYAEKGAKPTELINNTTNYEIRFWNYIINAGMFAVLTCAGVVIKRYAYTRH
jgi:hypothetical protein